MALTGLNEISVLICFVNIKMESVFNHFRIVDCTQLLFLWNLEVFVRT